MKDYVAERILLYSIKGESQKTKFTVKIAHPYAVDQDKVNFDIGSGVYACDIEVEGLNGSSVVYGVDSVQALNMATDLESLFRRLQKKYDLYWMDGDPYFDE